MLVTRDMAVDGKPSVLNLFETQKRLEANKLKINVFKYVLVRLGFGRTQLGSPPGSPSNLNFVRPMSGGTSVLPGEKSPEAKHYRIYMP